jgi:membrane associated rhomboid family serine protease
MFPLRDENKPSRPPITNLVLIFTCGVVFWNELSLFDQPETLLKEFITKWALVPARDFGKPSFTYLSHQFLHGGWGHFIFNMWSLWIFGDNIEDRMGRIGYLLFYLVCGVMAGLAQTALIPDSTMPMVGASGAISGVMAAYLFLYPKSKIVTFVPLLFLPLFFRVSAVAFIGVWFIVQVFSAVYLPESGVAFWAHIGGFVAGSLLHRLWVWGYEKSRIAPH